tara:strand:- start:83 stop:373 length:291 start_codon:yes stop_codon:yes gene_type:complete
MFDSYITFILIIVLIRIVGKLLLSNKDLAVNKSNKAQSNVPIRDILDIKMNSIDKRDDLTPHQKHVLQRYYIDAINELDAAHTLLYNITTKTKRKK